MTNLSVLEARATGNPGLGFSPNSTATPVSKDDRLPVTSLGFHPSVTITRPSNTTAYTAGDVIGQADAGTPANAGSAVLVFTNAGRAGDTILIICAELEIHVAAVPLGMTTFELELYDAAPDAILDNAAYALTSANDRAHHLCKIALGAPAANAGTLVVAPTYIGQVVKLAASSTSLWGQLKTVGGYTPTSGAVKKITLHAIGL